MGYLNKKVAIASTITILVLLVIIGAFAVSIHYITKCKTELKNAENENSQLKNENLKQLKKLPQDGNETSQLKTELKNAETENSQLKDQVKTLKSTHFGSDTKLPQ